MFLVLMVPCYHKLIGTDTLVVVPCYFLSCSRTRGVDCCVLLTGEDSSNKKGADTGHISIQGGQL